MLIRAWSGVDAKTRRWAKKGNREGLGVRNDVKTPLVLQAVRTATLPVGQACSRKFSRSRCVSPSSALPRRPRHSPCRFTRVRPHCNFLLIRYGLAALKASICRLRLLRRLQRLHPLYEAFTVWYRALLVCPSTRPEAPSLCIWDCCIGTSLRQSVSPLGSFRLTEQSSLRARENRRVEE